MGIMSSIKNSMMNVGGMAVGYLEMVGLRYPVEHYMFDVSPTLTRGSRLSSSEGAKLKADGYKLIVNLCAEHCPEPSSVAGLTLINIPIMDNQVPTLAQVDLFLRSVTNPLLQRAYVHCEAGKGRTGVMVACYRMAVDRWSADVAILEFKSYGTLVPQQEAFLRSFSEHLD